jgi:hypothetical protein
MDPIRPTQASALIESLRKLSKTKRTAAADAASAGDPSGTEKAQGRAALRDELRQLASGIDIHDNDALRSIQGAVLRCILKHEWGEQAESDPAFAGIVAAVNDAISRDARLIEVVRKAMLAVVEG